MKMLIRDLGEPEIEVGGGHSGKNPKSLLSEHGPIGSTADNRRSPIRLGLVALPSELELVKQWFKRMERLLLDDESNALRFPEFPGVEKAFHRGFEIPDCFVRRLWPDKFDLARSGSDASSFEALLDLYSKAICSLFSDQRPDCVLVCFPEEVAALRISNPRLSYQERLVLERLRAEEETDQLQLFEPTEEEKRVAAELAPQADELLFRNFHRALKARCMLASNPVPLQILRRQAYVTTEAKQSDATRAWNLALALYYKAGNIPWRPTALSSGTCFVGVSFHHLKRRSGDVVYASVAQVFSSEIEPFALKGASIPHDQVRNKQPYLDKDQAESLMQKVVTEYQAHAGDRPSRIIVHKTSHYQPEEEAGFRSALLKEVAVCDLVWLRPTGFRLLRRGQREPDRGTLCTIGTDRHFLFTTGYVPWWQEYPGPHIPAPLEIGACGETDIEARAREILTLTKMNWNSAEGIGRHPITIQFARTVGIVMTEMDEDATPNPLYRFYM
jgi:hypothetical protein